MLDATAVLKGHAAATPDPESTAPSETPVVATIQQGYETRLNVRLVRGREADIAVLARGCRPRQGAPRRDADPVALPPTLVDKLRAADAQVVAWLAKDPANARRFFAEPVAALREAGVELDRAEQKHLARAHGAVREASVVAPGVRVERLDVVGHRNGRVGDVLTPSKPQAGRDDDAGCGPTA